MIFFTSMAAGATMRTQYPATRGYCGDPHKKSMCDVSASSFPHRRWLIEQLD
jgi:hypothetical protein